jgi:hypothetical protein
MGKKSRSGSGMNIPDDTSNSLETIFGLKYLNNFDVDPDPGSSIFMTMDPGTGRKTCGSGIRDKHPGSGYTGTFFTYQLDRRAVHRRFHSLP